MTDSIFRQYDIRGRVGTELILEEAYTLGKSIAAYFLQAYPDIKTCVVGADGRTHSPLLKEHIINALLDAGIDVISIGLCTTPMMYFATYTMPVQGGLMITASHNGKEYNGIKITLNKEPVWGDQLQAIKHIWKTNEFSVAGKKGILKHHDILTDYLNWLAQHFSHIQGIDLSMVFDCAHGAAAVVLPKLIDRMNWSHAHLMYATIDGTFPAHEADPVVQENAVFLKNEVVRLGACLGIGFDGDADRMAPVSASRKLVIGDQLLAVFAQYFLRSHPGQKVLFDVKCSSALSQVIEQSGGVPVMSATGHSIIKNMMKKHNILLAGELSCHFFFKDRFFGYDDGIYSALRLIEIIYISGKSLDELLKVFPQRYNTPEIRVSCSGNQVGALMKDLETYFSARHDVSITTMDGVRISTPYGWGLVRASNTQPMVSMRFESDSLAGLQHIQDDFSQVLKKHIEYHFEKVDHSG